MKVCIEIKNKALMLAQGILMADADTEEDEKKLEAVVERLKASEEPILIDLDKMDNKEANTQLPMVLAIMAIAQEL